MSSPLAGGHFSFGLSPLQHKMKCIRAADRNVDPPVVCGTDPK